MRRWHSVDFADLQALKRTKSVVDGHDLQRMRGGWRLMKHTRGNAIVGNGPKSSTAFPSFASCFILCPSCRLASLFHTCKAFQYTYECIPLHSQCHQATPQIGTTAHGSRCSNKLRHVRVGKEHGTGHTSDGRLIKPKSHSYWVFRLLECNASDLVILCPGRLHSEMSQCHYHAETIGGNSTIWPM